MNLQYLIDKPEHAPLKTLTTTELIHEYTMHHTTRPDTGENVFFVIHLYKDNCNGVGGNIFQLEKLIPFNEE